MSANSVERVAAAERLARSTLAGTPDASLLAPGFEYEQHFGSTGGRYPGEEGLARWVQAFYEVWESASLDVDDARELDGRLALDIRVLVTAGHTGIEVELRATQIYEFAPDGRIHRMDSFNEASAAEEWLARGR